MVYVQSVLQQILVIVSDLLSFEMEEHQELMRKVTMYVARWHNVENNQYMT